MKTAHELYPNFVKAMAELSAGTPNRMILNYGDTITYSMPLVIYQRKVADTLYQLKGREGVALLEIATSDPGRGKVAVSYSKPVANDLSIKEWIEVLKDLIISHHHDAAHQIFITSLASSFVLGTEKKSGCLSSVVLYFAVAFILSQVLHL